MYVLLCEGQAAFKRKIYKFLGKATITITELYFPVRQRWANPSYNIFKVLAYIKTGLWLKDNWDMSKVWIKYSILLDFSVLWGIHLWKTNIRVYNPNIWVGYT